MAEKETGTASMLESATPTAVPEADEDFRGQDLLAPPPLKDAAVRKISNRPKDATAEEFQDALEWFLADDEQEADPTYTVELNISTDQDRKQWIGWSVKPLSSARIDALRRHFQVPVNREQRRRGVTGEIDAARFNAALVFEATVNPDMTRVMDTGKFSDGAQAVMHRFRHKPLLVDQIAGQILFLSGGDDEDMRVSREIRAAGNS